MVNNTTRGLSIRKQNIQPSTSAAGGTFGATMQSHEEYAGTFTVNGTSPITVAEPNVTANSLVIITLKTVGGTVSPSVPYISTITPGTGFTIVATASDTSVYNYKVILS